MENPHISFELRHGIGSQKTPTFLKTSLYLKRKSQACIRPRKRYIFTSLHFRNNYGNNTCHGHVLDQRNNNVNPGYNCQIYPCYVLLLYRYIYMYFVWKIRLIPE